MTTLAPSKLSPLGKLTPDPIGQLLGTGFKRFSSAYGVDGLAKEYGRRMDILALYVDPNARGQGNFRRFLEACQQHFRVIGVQEIMNDDLRSSLGRHGFTADGRSEDMIWEASQ